MSLAIPLRDVNSTLYGTSCTYLTITMVTPKGFNGVMNFKDD